MNPLNKHIIHYETLNYDPEPHLAKLHQSRVAARLYHESHPEANPLYTIDLYAHGRHLPLRLKRDIDSVFHQDLIIEDGNSRPIKVNLDHLVTGYLHNQPNSLAFGSIRDGIFEGKLHSSLPDEDILYIERAGKYFTPDPVDIYLLDERTNTSRNNFYELINGVAFNKLNTISQRNLPALPFHSVIYSSKHILDPFRHKRSSIG